MATIGEIANHIGLGDSAGGRAVLMAMVDGHPRHAYLGEAAAFDVDAVGDALYHASGLFRDGSIQGNRGRSADNLTEIVWLPFDADLLDYMGYPAGTGEEDKARRKAALDEFTHMTQPELDSLIAALRADLEETFRALAIPMHRLDYTGYGLCAYVYVDSADRSRVMDARAAHKHLVTIINEQYGDRIVDPQCSDAGTRVTRMPGSTNRKGAVPRRVISLVPYTGETCPLGHNPATPRPVARIIATTGDGLSVEDAKAFIAAVAPSWQLGQRHAVALAVAGMLAKAGIPENQAVQIIEALSHTDGDVWTQAITEVRTTYRRARQGSPIAGFTSLRSLLPTGAVAFIDQLLDRYRQSTPRSGAVSVGMFDVVGAAATKEKTSDLVTMVKSAPLPSACLTGWIKQYVDLLEPLSETSDAFNFACGLTLAGATLGRTVSARYISKSLHPNLYMMLVGAAGTSRKDTAIRLALEIPNYIAPPIRIHQAPFTVATDIGSAEGLIKLLQERPNTLLYITEYQRLSQNAHRQSTGTIFTMLTSAWDTPVALQNITKGSPLEARFPFLSVLAAVQPGILASEMQQADIESGYATRWLFVPGVGKAARPEPPDINEQDAFELYEHILRRRKDYEGATNGQGTKFYLSEQAKERWIHWYQQDRERVLASEDEDSMRSRLGVHVRKIALIYASLAGARAIELDHLEPAIAFVEWSWVHTRELMKGWGVGLWSQVENRIEQVLRERPGIQRRQLQQLCRGRKWSSREFAMVLDSMLKNGTIEIDATGSLRWAA